MEISLYYVNREEYKGIDAVSITNHNGMYVPMYLAKDAEGLAQSLKHINEGRVKKPVVIFDKINLDFFTEIIPGVIEDIKKNGESVIEKYA